MYSFIPISRLSASELHMLGNNVSATPKRQHSQLAAVNRSLAAHGEQVDRLHRTASGPVTRQRGKGCTHA